MQKQLQLLRDVQELDKEKQVVEKQTKAGAQELAQLRVEIEHLQKMVGSLADEIGALEGEKAELVAALTLEQQNIERSEGRLPQIKTQKEYVAVLKEIDTAKKLAKELQVQIDVREEGLTSLRADKAEKDLELAKGEETNGARCAEIDEAQAALHGKIEEMGRQRNTILEELPKTLRKRYELLLSRRDGLAVVEARNGACLGCHMHLPPQMYNSLFLVSEVQPCPHCNRLLYVVPQG